MDDQVGEFVIEIPVGEMMRFRASEFWNQGGESGS